MNERVSARVLAALVRATAIAADPGAPGSAVARLAECLRDAVSADFCAVYLSTREGGSRGPWRLEASSGDAAALPAAIAEDAGTLAPLLREGYEIGQVSAPEGSDAAPGWPGALSTGSLIGMPVRWRDGRLVGGVVVGSGRARAFSDTAMTCARSLAHILAMVTDNVRLTAAQQRERRMAAESAVTLGTVLESVGSGVCVVDLDGTIRLANSALQDLFGFPDRMTGVAEQALFQDATVPPRELGQFLRRLEDLLRDPSGVDQSEWELAGDPARIVQRYAAPMRNLQGDVVGRVEVYTEVTERRRLYTQLLQSEKLRAIGEMAAGIAHDFNNLLASIVGQTEILHPEDQSPETRRAIATIRQAALDGARTIRNLQGYSRKQVEAPLATADLNETVGTAVEMARPRWAGASLRGGQEIEVRVSLGRARGQATPRVGIDPSELREVLLNLLFNAADAMPNGGAISVATEFDARTGWGQVTVRDSGIGMPDAVRGRVFEPFFSTKGAAGNGLGLAVAYSIVTRHGGAIEVESEQGVGTSFTLRLPPPAPAGAKEEADLSTEGHGVRLTPQRLEGVHILAVDDEPGLLLVVRQLLERSGASVTSAEGGRAALHLLRDHSDEYDVVLTDLDMPDIDGWKVARGAKSRAPDRPVVMLTGWAGEMAPEDFRRRGIDAILAKPCRRSDLEQTIARLADSRAAPPSTDHPRPGAEGSPERLPLPAATDAARAGIRGAARNASEIGRGRRVLVVEDDVSFGGSLRDLLALHGFDVTLVDSAAAGLAAIRGDPPYWAVFTDYRLGDMTGAELAQQVVGEGGATPFFVLITGYAARVNDAAFLGNGVTAVLPKPCRGDDLRAVLAGIPDLSAPRALS